MTKDIQSNYPYRCEICGKEATHFREYFVHSPHFSATFHCLRCLENHLLADLVGQFIKPIDPEDEEEE